MPNIFHIFFPYSKFIKNKSYHKCTPKGCSYKVQHVRVRKKKKNGQNVGKQKLQKKIFNPESQTWFWRVKKI